MFNHRWQEKLLPASLGCIPGSQHVQKQRRTAPSWHEDYVNIGMLEAPISSFFGSSRWKVMLIPIGQRTWGSRVTLIWWFPGINQLFVRNQDVIFHMVGVVGFTSGSRGAHLSGKSTVSRALDFGPGTPGWKWFRTSRALCSTTSSTSIDVYDYPAPGIEHRLSKLMCFLNVVPFKYGYFGYPC